MLIVRLQSVFSNGWFFNKNMISQGFFSSLKTFIIIFYLIYAYEYTFRSFKWQSIYFLLYSIPKWEITCIYILHLQYFKTTEGSARFISARKAISLLKVLNLFGGFQYTLLLLSYFSVSHLTCNVKIKMKFYIIFKQQSNRAKCKTRQSFAWCTYGSPTPGWGKGPLYVLV